MTGGTVVVLGPVGWNFAAGMTGGRAFVHDPKGALARALNGETVTAATPQGADADDLFELISAHARETGSPPAQQLLQQWPAILDEFVLVEPRRYAEAAERKRA